MAEPEKKRGILSHLNRVRKLSGTLMLIVAVGLGLAFYRCTLRPIAPPPEPSASAALAAEASLARLCYHAGRTERVQEVIGPEELVSLVMAPPFHAGIRRSVDKALAGGAELKKLAVFTTEGGIIAPMIMAGPGIERSNEIHDGFVSLLDIAPSIYELAQAEYPDAFKGKEVFPLKGSSLIPFASGETEQVHAKDYVFGLEHNNFAMIRKGDWKITNISRPFSEDGFELYNVEQDLAELQDLKESEGDKYLELLEEWRKFSREVEVQIPPPGWD